MMTPQGQLAEDLADYLAVFVTPHIKPIERLIRAAVQRFRMVFAGYHGAPVDRVTGQVDRGEARKIVRKQAKVLFLMLKRYAGIRYTHSPINYGKHPTSVTQRIRPPYVSLGGTMGAGKLH